MCICFAASCDWSHQSVVEALKVSFMCFIQPTFPTVWIGSIIRTVTYVYLSASAAHWMHITYMFTNCFAGHLAVWICLCKMCMFMYPSPGVKRTFPHIPICGTEFPGVEQEAGAVLLVAFPGRPSPNRAPLVWAQHLIDGGAVLVSQGG